MNTCPSVAIHNHVLRHCRPRNKPSKESNLSQMSNEKEKKKEKKKDKRFVCEKMQQNKSSTLKDVKTKHTVEERLSRRLAISGLSQLRIPRFIRSGRNKDILSLSNPYITNP